jgi:hypothetical protein
MHRNPARSAVVVAAALALTPLHGMASVIGFLGNFDVINDSGSTAHGFEIELEGLHASDITDTFGGAGRGFPSGTGFDPSTAVERYGAPTITEYSNGSIFGTRVTYMATFDGLAGTWDFGTPSGTFITPGDNCWTGGGVGYGAGTPCDHFGVGTTQNPTSTKYSWLLETATPGVLSNGTVNLPAPALNVVPPQNAGNPPVVGAMVAAPLPEDPNNPEPQFGDAIWVKVFTTELQDAVGLEELVGGNPKVEAAVTEVEWQLLQYDPGNPDSPPSILESGYGAPVGPDAASILRRYEFFAYTGDYSLETHEAILAFSDSLPNCVDDPTCDYDPSMPIELGHYLGAQNVAANLLVAPVPVPAALPLMLSVLVPLVPLARRSAT